MGQSMPFRRTGDNEEAKHDKWWTFDPQISIKDGFESILFFWMALHGLERRNNRSFGLHFLSCYLKPETNIYGRLEGEMCAIKTRRAT